MRRGTVAITLLALLLTSLSIKIELAQGGTFLIDVPFNATSSYDPQTGTIEAIGAQQIVVRDLAGFLSSERGYVHVQISNNANTGINATLLVFEFGDPNFVGFHPLIPVVATAISKIDKVALGNDTYLVNVTVGSTPIILLVQYNRQLGGMAITALEEYQVVNGLHVWRPKTGVAKISDIAPFDQIASAVCGKLGLSGNTIGLVYSDYQNLLLSGQIDATFVYVYSSCSTGVVQTQTISLTTRELSPRIEVAAGGSASADIDLMGYAWHVLHSMVGTEIGIKINSTQTITGNITVTLS